MANLIVHEDPPEHADKRVEELEEENATLYRKVAALERQTQCQSPTKKSKTTNPRLVCEDGVEGSQLRLKNIDLNRMQSTSPTKTPGRKVRKLTARKACLDEDNIFDSP